jgi:serine/threonine protein kinase
VQVVGAVDYLHRQGVTHNDIKDENLLVARWVWCPLLMPAIFLRHGLTVTIIDFGSAVREDGKLTRQHA